MLSFRPEGVSLGYVKNFYARENDILGSEEFVDEMIHRIGEPENTKQLSRPTDGRTPPEPANFDGERLVKAVEAVLDISRSEFYGNAKSARLIAAKEALILAGRGLGASLKTLAKLTGLDASTVSRRHDAARNRTLSFNASADYARQVTSLYQSYKQ